jgi:hypothetical protein
MTPVMSIAPKVLPLVTQAATTPHLDLLTPGTLPTLIALPLQPMIDICLQHFLDTALNHTSNLLT